MDPKSVGATGKERAAAEVQGLPVCQTWSKLQLQRALSNWQVEPEIERQTVVCRNGVEDLRTEDVPWQGPCLVVPYVERWMDEWG